MQRIHVLLTSNLDGGYEPLSHQDFEIVLHRWNSATTVPRVDGVMWVFIDWELPDLPGIELCRRLRCDPATAHAHITMVMTGQDMEDRRRALRSGADDYMTGPLERATLLRRVVGAQRSELHRSHEPVLTQGPLSIDLATFQARWEGKPMVLMPNEFRLLRHFVENPGKVFTRAQLIAALGKQDPPLDERTVDVWVGRLRRAMRAVGAGNLLRTVRALGYVLDIC
jgi:two-component system, OmpR family, phosphate regulon response regulator PhoB